MITLLLGAAWAMEDCTRLQLAIDEVHPGQARELVLNPGQLCTSTLRILGGRDITIRAGGSTFAPANGALGSQIRVDNGSLTLVDAALLPSNSPAVGLIGGRLVLDNVLVAPSGGGSGIYVANGELEVRDSLFVGGVAGRGPHVDLRGGIARLDGTVFSGGLSLTRGGSVIADQGTSLEVVDCEFTGNRAQVGGALAFLDADVEVRGSQFSGNVAEQLGGAIAAVDGGSLLLVDSELLENHAEHGGALHLADAQSTVQTVTFCRNEADGRGGAIHTGDSAGRMVNVRFIENAALEGGAVASEGMGASVEYANFLGNRAFVAGAAVFADDGADLLVAASVIAWSGPRPAASQVTINGVVWWQNEGGNLGDEPTVLLDATDDPELSGFVLGAACATRSDFHRFSSPLRALPAAAPNEWADRTIPEMCDSPSSGGDANGYDLGAYGGPCGWPHLAWEDVDGDGYSVLYDCDDSRDEVNPDSMNDDPPYDGVDEDCDGSNDYDADRDGFVSKDHGGNDCNDDDANVHPGLSDQSPSVDVDCDGTAEDAAGTIRFVRQDCGANDSRDASFLLLAPLLAWRRRGR